MRDDRSKILVYRRIIKRHRSHSHNGEGINTMISLQSELLKPLSSSQLEQYKRDGFVIIKNGCSSDLIDAFNRHIFELRSAPLEETPDWARTSEKSRYSIRLFNPHQHDSFSRQVMKLPIVRGTLAQLMGKEAVCVQSMYFYIEPGSHGQAAHQDYYYIKNDPMTMVAATFHFARMVKQQTGKTPSEIRAFSWKGH